MDQCGSVCVLFTTPLSLSLSLSLYFSDPNHNHQQQTDLTHLLYPSFPTLLLPSFSALSLPPLCFFSLSKAIIVSRVVRCQCSCFLRRCLRSFVRSFTTTSTTCLFGKAISLMEPKERERGRPKWSS